VILLLRMLLCEWKKLRASSIWLPVCVAPLLAFIIGDFTANMDLGLEAKGISWFLLYAGIVRIHATIFLPLLAGILASLICRTEHLSGGWKQLLALPISRTNVYITKFFYVLLFLAVIQVLVLLGMVLGGVLFLHLHAPVPWSMLIQGFVEGWMATIPLAALQLWVSIWWKSFAAPFALNVVFTIPSAAIGSSNVYAPIYPWAQPMLAMLPNAHAGLTVTSTMAVTVALSGVVFIVGGWLYFQKGFIG
jgi:lantibiotic transport system permease protein